VPHPREQLRLNVGFLINQAVGTSRDFEFDVPALRIDDLDLNDLSGSARLTRTAQGILVQAKMNATLPAECVRCLIDFQQPLSVDFTELYAFTRDSITDSNLLLPDDAHIDLGPLVREYMLLEFPIRPLCRNDCKGLCPICGENLNEVSDHHHAGDLDPHQDHLSSS